MIIKLDIRESDLEVAFASLCTLNKTYSNFTINKENLPIGDIIVCNDEVKNLLLLKEKHYQIWQLV